MLDRLTKRGGWPYSYPPNCDFDINRRSSQAELIEAWWPTLGSRGNVLRDYSGRGLHGAFPGGTANPTWASDAVRGRVLKFDGADDYVDAGQVIDVGTSDFSVSFWVRSSLAATGVIVERIYDAFSSSGGDGWAISLNAAGYFSFIISSHQGSPPTTVNSNDNDYNGGQLHHVVVSADRSGNATFYIDGAAQGGGDISGEAGAILNATQPPLLIGINWNKGATKDYPFSGQIDDIRIRFRALSLSEARAEYQNPWQLYRPRVRWWPGYVAAGGPTYTLTADQGALSLTGQAAALLASRKLGADSGAISMAGQSAAVLAGRLLAAAQGTLGFSGQTAGLLVSRLLAADSGALALTGQDAGLLASRLLTADGGAISLTGQDATLLVARLLEAAAGTISLTGIDATLTYTPIGGPTYTLTAETGSIALAGQTAALLAARLLTGEAGAISLAGQDAAVLRGFLLSAETGAISISGQDAGLTLARVLAAATGTLTLAGQAVTLLYSGSVSVTPDSRIFLIVAEGRVYVIAAESRTYAVPGESRVYAINA